VKAIDLARGKRITGKTRETPEKVVRNSEKLASKSQKGREIKGLFSRIR